VSFFDVSGSLGRVDAVFNRLENLKVKP